MQCVFSGFPLHVMLGIAQTMLCWCKCTLTCRLFLVLPSYEWKTHLRDALPCTWKTYFRRHGKLSDYLRV